MELDKLLSDLASIRSLSTASEDSQELNELLDSAYNCINSCKLHKEIINNINEVMCTCSETDEIYRQVCDELHKLIDWDRVSIAVFEEARGIVTAFVLTKGVKTKIFPEKRKYPYEGSILEKIISTGEPVIIDDTKDGILATDKTHLKEGTRSRFAYPLKFKGKIVGCINFSSKSF